MSQHMDPRHLSIYKKIIAIQNPAVRLQMIDTVLGDPAFVQSTKSAGIYANILQVAAAIRHGTTPPLLPGEGHPSMSVQQSAAPSIAPPQHIPQRGNHASVQLHDTVLARQATQTRTPQQEVQRPKRSEKALNFFTACLRVLNIEEEVALTEEALTKSYKKAVIKAHPDKPGGSEEAFDAVTRAYAYLMDILKLVQGRQTRGAGATADAATPRLETVQQQRTAASQEWQMPQEPVKLNPKNLNMTAFNQLFEQTRIPDPDEDGYGDWLKNQDHKRGGGQTKKFSGEFNRDVFNRMFEQEAARDERQEQLIQYNHPQELMLAPTAGVELGRDRPNDYTAAPNASLKFTDLRAAYTRENTVSNQIQNVRVENRDFNQYKAQRERAPDMYNQQELASLQQMEAQTRAREDARRIRAAQEQLQARDYHERMKQLVIRE